MGSDTSLGRMSHFPEDLTTNSQPGHQNPFCAHIEHLSVTTAFPGAMAGIHHPPICSILNRHGMSFFLLDPQFLMY